MQSLTPVAALAFIIAASDSDFFNHFPSSPKSPSPLRLLILIFAFVIHLHKFSTSQPPKPPPPAALLPTAPSQIHANSREPRATSPPLPSSSSEAASLQQLQTRESVGHLPLAAAYFALRNHSPPPPPPPPALHPPPHFSSIPRLSMLQTQQIKGLLQLILLTYHYFGSRELLPFTCYCLARFSVTFFLFLTGYGHVLSASNSRPTLWKLLWGLLRLNILTLIASVASGNNWSYYYFTPLATLWTFVVSLSLLVMRPSSAAIFLFLVLVLCCWCFPAVISWADGLVGSASRKRVSIDIMSPAFGMLLAAASSSPLFTSISRSRLFSPALAAAAAAAAAAIITIVLVDDERVNSKLITSDDSTYMRHCIWFPPAVVMLICMCVARFGWLGRKCYAVLAFAGTHSLEMYVLQYHCLMSHSVKRIITIIPDYGHMTWSINIVITVAFFAATCAFAKYTCNAAVDDVRKLLLFSYRHRFVISLLALAVVAFWIAKQAAQVRMSFLRERFLFRGFQ